MRCGLFGGAGVPRGDPIDIGALRLADYIDYIETNAEAEALGFTRRSGLRTTSPASTRSRHRFRC